jgi:hypothetical protein
MNAQSAPNLDKLRNIVQRFGATSFTTAQVASEYDDGPATSDTTRLFDELLARHAAVLGIQAVPGGHSVWQMA